MIANTRSEAFSSLIQQAVMAPSSHNTQPWRFRISATDIDVYADRTRALPANDPNDRELTISCGCALLNLRVAAASLGLHSRVQLLPSAHEPDWLARMSFVGEPSDTTADAKLSAYIAQRRTYRKPFAPREVATTVAGELIEAAVTEGCWLRSLQGSAVRQQIAALVAAGDAAQWADRGWRLELAAWMRPRQFGEGLTVPALARPLTEFVVRNFNLGRTVAAKDRRFAETAPLLVVFETEHDQPRDWLNTGQALQRVLLTACEHGLLASFLNQPVQVAALRPRLQAIACKGFPQILLRIGYPGQASAAAPRRSSVAVIDDTTEN